jgi:hypothetical protein
MKGAQSQPVALGCILVCAAVALGSQKPLFLPPVDEAKQDVSFARFREELRAAVKRRDVKYVLASTLPNLVYAYKYGELEGREALASDLPDDQDRLPRISPTWTLLERALDLGGAFSTTHGAQYGRREFCAPYYYATLPQAHKLPSDLLGLVEGNPPVVILGRNVPVRANSEPTSAVIGRLSYQVVPFVGNANEQVVSVLLRRDTTGWVERRLAGVIEQDYHACFARVDGNWRMSVFAPGEPPMPPPGKHVE